jgi:mannose-6-phosphate isomerase-like protein (cupin superfamily)
MNEKDGKKYKLLEKSWILSNEKKTFENKLTSTGVDMKAYFHTDDMTAGSVTLPPGKYVGKMSAHQDAEMYYIIRGELKVELPRLKETVLVKAGEMFYMPGGMIHAPFNDSKEECFFIWICGPNWP